MIIYPDTQIIDVDVDETLLIPEEGCFVPRDVNHKLVKKLREWHAKGKTITVWTSNADGVKWAVRAVELCGIEDIVFSVRAKPTTIVDDDHLEYYTIIDPITFEWGRR